MAVLLSHSAHGLVWWGVSTLPEEHQLLFPTCEKASRAVPEHSEAAHLPLPPHRNDRPRKVRGERFVFITWTSHTVIPPRYVMNQPRAFYRRITVSQWQHMALAQPRTSCALCYHSGGERGAVASPTNQEFSKDRCEKLCALGKKWDLLSQCVLLVILCL